LIEVGLASDRQAAVTYGRHLVTGGVIEHSHQDHHFYDIDYFYRFLVNVEDDTEDHLQTRTPDAVA